MEQPSRSRKSDEDLLREHGIDRECRVVLVELDNPPGLDQDSPKKTFQVHYGRQFLWHIAQLSYRHPVSSVDLDRLYSQYITSHFSSLDRERFKQIVRAYYAQWETDFRERRAKLLKVKREALAAKRKACRLCKVTYGDQSVVVPFSEAKLAKAAMKSRTKVLLERISLDETVDSPPPAEVVASSPQSTNVSNEPDSAVEDSNPASGRVSDSPPPPPFRFLLRCDENLEDRRTAIGGLVLDLIAKVSDEQDPDGASNMSSTDCYSDDTVESPMEVEFGSGESPDFSKVLRDSEETSHGDEFYEVSRVQPQQLPNGNSAADKASCVIQKTITRSHDKPLVVMKL